MEPHRTSKPLESVNLTHALFPWDGEFPCYLSMPDSEYLYLPCFTSADKLRAMMDQVGITGYTIKHIDDGPEFLTSFDVPEAKNVKVILDPHFVDGGKVRFLQVSPSAN